MASRRHQAPANPPAPPTARDVSAYSYGLLLSLRRVALYHDLALLAHLLRLAAAEAQRIADAAPTGP